MSSNTTAATTNNNNITVINILGHENYYYDTLPDNASRWDKIGAVSTAGELELQWWILGGVSFFTTLVVGTVLTAILYYKPTRQSPFNQYLIGLMIPDLVFSANCVYACWLSAASSTAAGQFFSVPLCHFQSWFLTFGIAGNAWMNLAICVEVYQMLKAGARGRRYFPPTTRKVWRQTLCVYFYSALLASLELIPLPNLPMETRLSAGYYCMTVEYDLGSALFFFLVFLPLLCGIPMLYAGYVFYDVYCKSHLMPSDGRAKLLAIYFLRIIVVFYVWWMPAVFLSLVFTGFDPWYQFVFGSVLSHLQGTASTAATLLKPDVREATLSLLCGCRPFRTDVLSQSMLRQSRRRRSSVMRLTTTSSTPPLQPQSSSSSSFLQRIIGTIRGNSESLDGGAVEEVALEIPGQSSSRIITDTTLTCTTSLSGPLCSWYELSEADREKGIFVGNENHDNDDEPKEEGVNDDKEAIETGDKESSEQERNEEEEDQNTQHAGLLPV